MLNYFVFDIIINRTFILFYYYKKLFILLHD